MLGGSREGSDGGVVKEAWELYGAFGGAMEGERQAQQRV